MSRQLIQLLTVIIFAGPTFAPAWAQNQNAASTWTEISQEVRETLNEVKAPALTTRMRLVKIQELERQAGEEFQNLLQEKSMNTPEHDSEVAAVVQETLALTTLSGIKLGEDGQATKESCTDARARLGYSLGSSSSEQGSQFVKDVWEVWSLLCQRNHR